MVAGERCSLGKEKVEEGGLLRQGFFPGSSPVLVQRSCLVCQEDLPHDLAVESGVLLRAPSGLAPRDRKSKRPLCTLTLNLNVDAPYIYSTRLFPSFWEVLQEWSQSLLSASLQ